MSSRTRILIIGTYNTLLLELLRQALKEHDISVETQMREIPNDLESFNSISFCTPPLSPYEKKRAQNTELKKEHKKDRLSLNKKMAQAHKIQHNRGLKTPLKRRSKIPQYRNKMR